MEEPVRQPHLQVTRTSGFLLELGSHSSDTIEYPHSAREALKEAKSEVEAVTPLVRNPRLDIFQTDEREHPCHELGQNYTTVIAPIAENLTSRQIPRQTPPIAYNGELIRQLVPEVVVPEKSTIKPIAERRSHRASIDSWYFTRTIGTGSMGKVKLAKNSERPEEICAVKVVTRALKAFLISEQHIAPPKTRVAARRRAKRLQKEIVRDKRVVREAALGILCNHSNICSLLDFRTLPNHFYLFFEYIDGGQLLDYIVRSTRLREPQIRKFSRAILDALNYLHMNNIVHRDLKIENIMIAKDGTLKLIDFGLSNFYYKQEWGDNVSKVSRSVDNRDVAPLLKTFCGSLYFAAPELLNAKPYIGPEIDVWSFGVVLYVLTCGKVPFDDENSAVLHQKIKSGRVSYPRKVPPGIKDILTRIFVVNSRRRISLKEIMEHPWMTKGYEDTPLRTGLPLRLPLLEQNIDMLVINEMIHLDLTSDKPDEVREKLVNIINEREYLQLSRDQWRQINTLCSKFRETGGESKETYYELPTTAYHPLLSQYYLVKEHLKRKYGGKQQLHLSDPGFYCTFKLETESTNNSQNITVATAADSSPTSDAVVNVGDFNDGNNQQNKSGIFSRNIFSKFMKYSSPHVSPTRKTHFNPSNDTICSTVTGSTTSGEQSSQNDLGKFLRKCSLVANNNSDNENNGSNVRPNILGNMGVRHTRAVSDLTANDYLYGIPQNTATTDSRNDNNNKNSNTGQAIELVDRNNDWDTVSAGSTLVNPMLSIEYPHQIFLNGFFSPQTITTKPLTVVRYKIIQTLRELNASYVEIKGGFICSVDYDRLSDTDPVTSPKPRRYSDQYTPFGLNNSHGNLPITPQKWEQPFTKRSNSKNRDEAKRDDCDNVDVLRSMQPTGGTVFRLSQNTTPWNLSERDLILFEINIVKIKLVGLSGVRIKRHIGDPAHYKNFTSRFLKMLDL